MTPPTPPGDSAVGESLRTIATHRVFFGHQSVGEDLCAGLRELAVAAEVDLRILDAREAQRVDGGVLLHARVGKNREPRSKFTAFGAELHALRDTALDLALVKLCYVDVDAATPRTPLLDAYRAAVADWRAVRPGLRLAHVTVPLTCGARGWRAALKRRLGRADWTDADNAARARFNDELRACFPGDPLIDLAHAESVDARGRPVEFLARDAAGAFRARALVPSFTEDGGHLAGHGRRLVAARFAAALAAALR